MAAAQEAVFVMATNEVGAPTYNPIKANNLNIGTTLIFDRLVSQDADLSFHPWLAESWEEAPDGMSWTFKLKKGVKFHNGEPFNAQTIVDWLELFKGTENAYMTEAIDKVDVVDENTVKFVMTRPEPNLLYNLSSSFMSVIEPKSYEALGDNYGVTEVDGTGPFKMESFTVGQETVLVRNDDYAWASPLAKNRGPAKIAKLTCAKSPKTSTAFLELKIGRRRHAARRADRLPWRGEEGSKPRRGDASGPGCGLHADQRDQGTLHRHQGARGGGHGDQPEGNSGFGLWRCRRGGQHLPDFGPAGIQGRSEVPRSPTTPPAPTRCWTRPAGRWAPTASAPRTASR